MAEIAANHVPKTGAETTDKSQKPRPEKPDDDKYKENLARVEKEHAISQEKLVCLLPFPYHEILQSNPNGIWLI